MHYTARNFTILAFALMVINILTGIVAFLHVYVIMEGTMFIRPVVCIFLITSIALFITTCFALWNLHKDSVDDSQEALNNNIRLNKRIDELEKEIASLKYQIKS